jgi:hypothetical protein
MTDDTLTSLPPLPPEGAARLLDQMFRIWIEPAIEERQLGLSRDDVQKALVVLALGQAPQVSINDEAELVSHFQVTRAIEHGEAVTLGDISGIAGLQAYEVDPNAGWIVLA